MSRGHRDDRDMTPLHMHIGINFDTRRVFYGENQCLNNHKSVPPHTYSRHWGVTIISREPIIVVTRENPPDGFSSLNNIETTPQYLRDLLNMWPWFQLYCPAMSASEGYRGQRSPRSFCSAMVGWERENADWYSRQKLDLNGISIAFLFKWGMLTLQFPLLLFRVRDEWWRRWW